MYPFIRFATALVKARRALPLALGEEHVSRHICWPWDIDPWMELNNGRILTLYDMGRIGLFVRSGLLPVMRERGWVGTVAGSSVRYRRRLRAFDRYTLRTRVVGWDARFVYVEQGMWRKGECTSQGLLRLAIATRAGIVPTAEMARAFGIDPTAGALPDWVRAWAEAEAQRPWPPMQAASAPIAARATAA